MPRTWRVLALLAAVMAVVMAWVYVAILRAQGDSPYLWVLAVLLVGAGLSVYGAFWSPYRRPALLAGGILLILLGGLAILSIGLPIILAGLLAVLAFALSPRKT
jgi:hypothetical protein